jgi:hypothetical protein
LRAYRDIMREKKNSDSMPEGLDPLLYNPLDVVLE